MEEGRLKQRLVGAMVLVALAVIFIPILLSGDSEMEMPTLGSNVPERSAEISSIQHIDINETPTPTRAVNVKRIPIAEGMPEPKVVKDKKALPIVDKKIARRQEERKSLVTHNVWAVQVGSFSKRSNALGLKDKLRKKSIHAFVERIVTNNKTVYRVRVGPEITRKKAEALKTKLKKEFKLSGLVVKHP